MIDSPSPFIQSDPNPDLQTANRGLRLLAPLSLASNFTSSQAPLPPATNPCLTAYGNGERCRLGIGEGCLMLMPPTFLSSGTYLTCYLLLASPRSSSEDKRSRLETTCHLHLGLELLLLL